MQDIQDVLRQPSLERLRKSYSENRTGRGIVFFVGSGLSRSAGLPDWKELGNELAKECKRIYDLNKISQAAVGKLFHKMESEGNMWKKFEYIREILGNTSFSAAVKMMLSTEEKKIPEIYKTLCDLNVSGFISLNIDNFLTRAMQERFSDAIFPVYGQNSEDRLSELVRKKPFLYQPHGSILSESSWVFTEDDFNRLCSSALHDEFLSSIFLRDTVVFVGISANDPGASLRLAKLSERRINPKAHFWIASTSHLENREWAESNGIQQILYPSGLGHDHCVYEIFRSIEKYSSKDEVIKTPVVGQIVDTSEIWDVSPSDLFKYDDIDQIRITLNAIINHKANGGDITYQDYSEICRKYARAIHSCYMMPTGDSDEKWFGYRITGKALGGKTIGRIMPAVDDKNCPVAIKILDQRRYSDELYLSAFRRGIKALKILRDRNIQGTIEVKDAYEVPPTIVMDYINCASLDAAVSAKKITPVNCLRVMQSVSLTILEAHLLPEIVLHRDIRPTNVLLEDFDWESGSFKKVNVIDFDLGWHKGALGDDFIRSDRDSLGYQAPEQIVKGESSQRRTTLIDSYGLGATLYFCITRLAPDLGIHRDDKWPSHVDKMTGIKFKSTPEVIQFISRTVVSAMSEDSKNRISVSEIHDRLSDLIKWLENDTKECSADFVAEMLCALSSPGRYEIDSRRKIFSFHASSGLTSSINFDFTENVIEINLHYQKPGNIENSRADKVLTKLKNEFHDIFNGVYTSKISFSFDGSRQFRAIVTIPLTEAKNNIYKVKGALAVIVRLLNIQ